MILPIDKKLESHYERYPGFSLFWEAYPNKVGKRYALSCWLREGCEPYAEQIAEDVRARASAHPNWVKDGGRYIPNPSTYINQHRWTEDIPQQHQGERELTRNQLRDWASAQGMQAGAGESWDSYDARIRAAYHERRVN